MSTAGWSRSPTGCWAIAARPRTWPRRSFWTSTAWLHQAAVHTSLNRLRSRRRREKRELTQALAERPAPPDDPARLAEVAEQRETVRHALTRLRPKAAAVLILRYSGLSYAEVGAALQVGTGQVGTLLRRAEQALKKELEVGTPV